EHRMLAGEHVLGDDQFVELAERLARRLHIHEEFWYDAGDLAAIVEHTCRDRAHNTLGAAAIDQPQPVRGNGFSKRAAGGHVGRIASRLGTAINTDGSNWHTMLQRYLRRLSGTTPGTIKMAGNCRQDKAGQAEKLVNQAGKR